MIKQVTNLEWISTAMINGNMYYFTCCWFCFSSQSGDAFAECWFVQKTMTCETTTATRILFRSVRQYDTCSVVVKNFYPNSNLIFGSLSKNNDRSKVVLKIILINNFQFEFHSSRSRVLCDIDDGILWSQSKYFITV